MNILKDAFNTLAKEVFIFTKKILLTATSILFTAALNWPKFYVVLKIHYVPKKVRLISTIIRPFKVWVSLRKTLQTLKTDVFLCIWALLTWDKPSIGKE